MDNITKAEFETGDVVAITGLPILLQVLHLKDEDIFARLCRCKGGRNKGDNYWS